MQFYYTFKIQQGLRKCRFKLVDESDHKLRISKFEIVAK